jgi:hypothetical protein
MRTGTTYSLKVEGDGDMLDCSCDYKTRAGTTYSLEVERVTCQIAVENTTQGRDNIQPGGGETGQHVRLQV